MNSTKASLYRAGTILFAATALAACGGGGGSGSSIAPPVGPSTPSGSPSTAPSPSPSPTPTTSTQYAGKVVDYNTGNPIAGATVYVGQTLVVGATPPPTLPAGDVVATTAADGTFTVAGVTPTSISCVLPNPAAPTTSNGVVSTCTANVMVFSDHITLHAPIQLAAGIGTLKVSTASSGDVAWLNAINTDRANNGSGPVVLDERLMEATRLWVAYNARNCLFADSNPNAPAPYSSSITVAGSLGAYNVVIAQNGTVANAGSSGVDAEANFRSEGPTGPHYSTIIAGSAKWTGFGIGTYGPTSPAPCVSGNLQFTNDFIAPPSGGV